MVKQIVKKILNIITSIKGDASFSNKLSNAVLEKLTKEYPASEVKTFDLSKTPLPYLNEVQLSAFYTPEEAHTTDQSESIKLSDDAITDLLEADIIVIGVPMYNFGIPALLKGWIDQVARAGKTFSYDENGPKGLISGKKVFLSVASGAVFSDGPYKSYDFAEPYLRVVLGFLGITDVTTFRVEGTSIPDFADSALPNALAAVEEFAF
ncbi:FMN-dependent NADH-azoreductase [Flavobacterium sp. C3NV]|uniref:FMN-dependent NADH-azoreductase n=1 Tax=Flavobacterium sp. C3NV TaxID=3393358 RepID=UPI00398F9242